MKRIITFSLLLFLAAQHIKAQVSGVVYKDYNGNGSQQTVAPSNEPGAAGVIVNAYNTSNALVATTTSANDGTYSLATTGQVRIEFEIPTGLNCVSANLDYTGFSGDGNNIRFINGSASNVNYAVLLPNDYVSNTDPFVYVPIYTAGDPLGGGNAGTQTGFIGYLYSSAVSASSSKTLPNSVMGTVWGGTYSKQAKKIFTSAFLKRQAGLGPLGSGGIYMLEPTASSFNVTNFYDMDANGYRTRATAGAVAYGDGSSFTIASGTTITYNGATDPESGFPEGLGVIGSNATRTLPASMTADSYDPAAFDQVGKVGLGDLQISDDGKFLFVMNLYSRKLYRLELDDAYNPTAVIAVTSYAIPSVAVTNGVLRPFAVSYHRNKVYVGAVASGENGGSNTIGGATDLYAFVFEMTDPKGTASFNASPIMNFPLNYQKGYPIQGLNLPTQKQWYPWSNNTANTYGSGEFTWSSPVLSNIEFTDRGDMVLDFFDRGGHQYGYTNFKNLNSSAPGSSSYDVSGDILMAGRDCSTGGFTLENNGSYSSNGITITSAGAGNTEGPGGGEFYYLEIPPDNYHHETSQGSVAIVPGSRNGIFTLMDANAAFSGGTGRFNTDDASATNRLTLYGGSDGTFSKANGLGDIEVAGDEPGIEIGNRVWLDADVDGIQDAGENGIANVTIELFCDNDNNNIPDGASIASTNTDAEGHWYFNSSNVVDGDCVTAGNQAGPQKNKTYLVQISSSDWTGGLGVGDLNLLSLSSANAPVTGIIDATDNDAVLVSSIPQIQITTGKLGENNHSYDFGFKSCVADAGSDIALDCNTPSGTIGTAGFPGDTYAWLPAAGLSSTTVAQPTASPSSTTTYTLTVNGLCSDEVTVTVNNTTPTADAGSTQNLDCTTTSATIGTSAIGGNSYAWSPAAGLSATNIAQPTASPSATTTYTVTVTGSNGCTATSTVTVNVNTTTPTADAGATQNLDCTTTSATIGTAAIGGNTYAWSPATGLSATNIAQPTANPSATTTYTVTVTGSNGCTATSTVTVNVNTTAPTADAGATQNLDCITPSATIGTTAIGGNTYAWSPAAGLSATNIAQPTASPSATTTYTVTVTGSNGCTATSTVTVNVNNTTPTADAGATQNLDCTTTSATIGTSAIGGNTYAWSPAAGLNATNIAQPTANPSATTTYTVTVTGSNGCTATSTVMVNVNTTAPTADAGATQNLDCTTTSATIGTSAIGGSTYAWSPATGLSATNIAQPTANPSATTTYTVTVTGSNGCTATSTVTVNVNTTVPNPTITGTTIVCNGSTTTVTANGGVSYVWNTTAVTPAITVGEGSYTVTATAANGCTATTSVDVNNVEGSVGNYVWYDANGNGLNDEASTSGINGLTVELWKETSSGSNTYVLDQTTTTANDISSNPGYYTFAICESANYKVKFPLVSGGQGLTEQTTTTATDNNNDANPTDGFSPSFAIDVNGVGVAKDNNTIDAGYYKPAQLGNYVWNDIDKDGIQDANEVGVAGITVTLYNNSNVVVANTITDAYGYYKFAPLDPGTYHVSFTLPANYVFTLQDAVGNDETDNDVNPTTGITGNYVLVAGDSNMTVDAGIYFVRPITASVGNYVWLDVNQDGIQDAGEEGISGVTVTLYNNLGSPVATMLTDANGFYLFTNVVPGTYTVGFTPKAGLAISPNNGLVSNPSNSDANVLTGITSSITVNAGDEITYVDAGMYPIAIDFPLLGGLGDKVWYDVDQDGVQDANETGVSGVTVTLYQNDGVTVISTTTTNAFGDYIFNSLSQGQYVVGFSNLPLGYVLTTTTGTDSTTNSDANVGTGKTPVINLAAGQYNLTYDAGIYNTNVNNNNSIGDKVWDDTDKDGIQDPTESGVSGVTVTLYDNTNTPIAVTSTDMNGMYLFPNLPNGTYYVGFSNLPVGYVFSPAGQGTAATDSDPSTETGLTSSVTLTGGTNITDLDAGINLGNTRIGLGTLGDLVWYDINNNGLQDPNESGVAGVTVTLYQQDGVTVIKTTTTDALGNYIFTDLDAGSYVVGFTNLPAGFTISPKNSDSQGLNGELNSDVNSGTQKTDVITLGTGEDKMSVDMGITPPAGTASLGNFVWFDLNNDGLQTSGEPGVQGVSVSLLNSTGDVIATTTTDANGEYYFIGLNPGTYSVSFSNLPNGYTLTTENADANGINGTANSDANVVTGQTVQVTLAINDNNLNLDAGIISTTVASVGDYVWFDADQDGIQDPSESGIGGVLVTLYDNTNTPVASAITRPDGGYIFTNVVPGTYTIGFSNTPLGMVFTQEVGTPTDNDNSNVNPATGLTASFTVLAGTHNPTIDAGLTTPLVAGLGNYVWHDVNENGFQDASEPGVAGVQVTLYASNGTTVLATAVTDGNGAYSFTNLESGTYIVGFSNLPSGSTRTKTLGVLNDALNSDMNLGGKTNAVTLTAGEYNPNIDAGIYFGVPLPAKELTATLAIIKANNVCEVNWYTKDESNTKSFDIERSIDGTTFAKVGETNASGQTEGRTNYVYNDDIASISNVGVIYYRIKLNDIDNKYSYSNTISARQSNLSNETVTIYPSPFTTQINIDYVSLQATDINIELTDASGRVIVQKMVSVEEGSNTIQLDQLNALSTGSYYIKLKDINSGELFIRKLVK